MDFDYDTDDSEIIMRTTDPDLPWVWSYVLTALDIPHRVTVDNQLFFLKVPMEFAATAVQEIHEYFEENASSRQNTQLSTKGGDQQIQPPTVLLIGMLILLYAVTGPWDGNSVWFQKGAGNSQAILANHEWFRLVTALTLHANFLHLLNNCLLGGFLLHFLLLSVGTGIGLFALLTASIAGNGINVLLHGPGHIFVGFSTAVFAVIGMLSLLSYKNTKSGFRSYFQIPLMGAFALLAMVGSSGKHTDLGAHLFGLICGLFIGVILKTPTIKNLRDSFAIQTAFFLFSLFIFTFSWVLALSK